ncbi:response regulator [Paenibacillus chartarius]|uniref:Response regulator n=1 Tax=Paenibacillus chartarius TaxID=747481 RepID=A0ABV6DSJ1_9BACL
MYRYRVLIVDDEPEIRMGHRLKVDWEELGMTVAGEASNGMEALELLESEPFDIALVDMNMPVMGGVSLMEACRERYPHLKLIVITGYEDFHYAKAALHSKAVSYLLKPVSRDELSEALGQLKERLDAERKAREESRTAQWRLSQYYKEMKEHFLLHVVKEPLEQERIIRERARMFELEDWDDRTVRFVTVGLREQPAAGARQGEEGLVRAMRLPFELISREFAAEFAAAVQTYRDPYYPGLMHFIIENDTSALHSFQSELSLTIKERVRLEPVIGIGEPVRGFTAWKAGALSSLAAWSMAETGARGSERGAGTGSAAGAAGGMAVRDDGRPVLAEETALLLQRLLQRGELEAYEQTARHELARAHKETKSRFVKLIFQLYMQLDAAARESGSTLQTGEELWLRPDLVLELDSADQAAGFLVSLARRMGRGAGDADPADPERSAIEAAKQYIQDHYMMDIHLGMLADKFKYNASYFSELFKSKVGVTFIQFLTEVRMAQAVRLLEETELGLWDIAELTGFSNPSYFSSKFKKMYGTSPSEFRQRASKKNDTEQPKK